MRPVRLTAVFLVALLLMVLPNVSYAGKNDLVNMNVVNGNVRDVLMSLGKIGHTSIVIDDKVQGTVTVNLRYVPFEDALDIIAQVKGLSYDRIGNTIVVLNRDSSDKDKTSYKSNLGTIHILKLKHVKAEDVIDKVAMELGDKIDKEDKTRKDAQNINVSVSNKSSEKTNSEGPGKMSVSKMARDSVLPDYEHVKIDPISNALVIKCTESDYSKILQLMDQLDVRYPEVLLEAKIVSINKTGQDQLGIDWSWQGATKDGLYTIDGGLTKSILFGRSNNRHSVDSKLALNALFTSNNAKILAKPQIVAINGKPAFIHVGDSLPTITLDQDSNGNKTYTIKDYVDTGIILTYIPVINTDGTITASIKTEVSVPTQIDSSILQYVYKFARKRAETEIVMNDGETIVIGGLLNKQDTKIVGKIPLLGDLPIIGGFFKNVSDDSEDSEVVIFLTATIVKHDTLSPVKAKETGTINKTSKLLEGELSD